MHRWSVSTKVEQMTKEGEPPRHAPDIPPPKGGVVANMLGFGAVLYILLAVGCAAYILWPAYSDPTKITAFGQVAIAALIAVIGTGLTGFAAVYGATRQSATAYQVAQYGGTISENLALMRKETDVELTLMKGKLDASLADLKAASDESLTRLKVALDAGQNANRELFGALAIYFHALRSAAYGSWDTDNIKEAEGLMISATRHVIYVDKALRDQWFDFWQRAQDIHRIAAKTPAGEKRREVLTELIGERVETNSGKLNLRELYDKWETTARQATEAAGTSTRQPTA
jgi:hypothetical protein